MSWADVLALFRKDESRDWPAQRAVKVVLDLGRRSMNEIALGAPGSALRVFGQPDNRRPFRERRFVYRRIGLVVEVDGDGRADYFGLAIVPEAEQELDSCQLEVATPRGERLAVNQQTKLEAITQRLGATESRDEDEDEIVATFRVAGCCLEVECASDGRIRRVNFFAADVFR